MENSVNGGAMHFARKWHGTNVRPAEPTSAFGGRADIHRTPRNVRQITERSGTRTEFQANSRRVIRYD